MYFRVKNKNISLTYPLATVEMGISEDYDKVTGNTYYALELKSLEDILSLDALCKVCNPYYLGLKINGNEITFLETEYEFEKEL